MEKMLWKARLLPGMREEYIRRHDQIWPEMVEALRTAGICNYTIWNNGDELIGYYECPSLEDANRFERTCEVMHRWDDSMKGVMEMEREQKTGSTRRYEVVFELI